MADIEHNFAGGRFCENDLELVDFVSLKMNGFSKSRRHINYVQYLFD